MVVLMKIGNHSCMGTRACFCMNSPTIGELAAGAIVVSRTITLTHKSWGKSGILIATYILFFQCSEHDSCLLFLEICPIDSEMETQPKGSP